MQAFVRSAINAEPGSIDFSRGCALHKQTRFSDALEAFKRADREGFMDDNLLQNKLGETYASMGQYSQAFAAYAKAKNVAGWDVASLAKSKRQAKAAVGKGRWGTARHVVGEEEAAQVGGMSLEDAKLHEMDWEHQQQRLDAMLAELKRECVELAGGGEDAAEKKSAEGAVAMFAGPGGLAGKMAAKGRAAKASMASEKEGENAFVLAVRTLYVYGSRLVLNPQTKAYRLISVHDSTFSYRVGRLKQACRLLEELGWSLQDTQWCFVGTQMSIMREGMVALERSISQIEEAQAIYNRANQAQEKLERGRVMEATAIELSREAQYVMDQARRELAPPKFAPQMDEKLWEAEVQVKGTQAEGKLATRSTEELYKEAKTVAAKNLELLRGQTDIAQTLRAQLHQQLREADSKAQTDKLAFEKLSVQNTGLLRERDELRHFREEVEAQTVEEALRRIFCSSGMDAVGFMECATQAIRATTPSTTSLSSQRARAGAAAAAEGDAPLRSPRAGARTWGAIKAVKQLEREEQAPPTASKGWGAVKGSKGGIAPIRQASNAKLKAAAMRAKGAAANSGGSSAPLPYGAASGGNSRQPSPRPGSPRLPPESAEQRAQQDSVELRSATQRLQRAGRAYSDFDSDTVTSAGSSRRGSAASASRYSDVDSDTVWGSRNPSRASSRPGSPSRELGDPTQLDVSRAGLIPPVRASTAPAVMAPPPESERPLTPVKALIDGEVSPEAPRAAIARAFQSHRLTEKLHEERAAKELADRLRAEREEAARQKGEAARLEKQRLAARWSSKPAAARRPAHFPEIPPHANDVSNSSSSVRPATSGSMSINRDAIRLGSVPGTREGRDEVEHDFHAKYHFWRHPIGPANRHKEILRPETAPEDTSRRERVLGEAKKAKAERMQSVAGGSKFEKMADAEDDPARRQWLKSQAEGARREPVWGGGQLTGFTDTLWEKAGVGRPGTVDGPRSLKRIVHSREQRHRERKGAVFSARLQAELDEAEELRKMRSLRPQTAPDHFVKGKRQVDKLQQEVSYRQLQKNIAKERTSKGNRRLRELDDEQHALQEKAHDISASFEAASDLRAASAFFREGEEKAAMDKALQARPSSATVPQVLEKLGVAQEMHPLFLRSLSTLLRTLGVDFEDPETQLDAAQQKIIATELVEQLTKQQAAKSLAAAGTHRPQSAAGAGAAESANLLNLGRSKGFNIAQGRASKGYFSEKKAVREQDASLRTEELEELEAWEARRGSLATSELSEIPDNALDAMVELASRIRDESFGDPLSEYPTMRKAGYDGYSDVSGSDCDGGGNGDARGYFERNHGDGEYLGDGGDYDHDHDGGGSRRGSDRSLRSARSAYSDGSSRSSTRSLRERRGQEPLDPERSEAEQARARLQSTQSGSHELHAR